MGVTACLARVMRPGLSIIVFSHSSSLEGLIVQGSHLSASLTGWLMDSGFTGIDFSMQGQAADAASIEPDTPHPLPPEV